MASNNLHLEVAVYHDLESELSGKGPSTWLVTFTDAMALMLTFFVLMFAMAEPEHEYWTDIATALQAEFHEFHGPRNNAAPIDSLDLRRDNKNKALDVGYLSIVLDEAFQKSPELSGAFIQSTEDAIIVSFPDNLLFEAGSLRVGEKAKEVLYALTSLLKNIDNSIEIHGHSDPTRIGQSNRFYDNNWGLSMGRAMLVADQMREFGYQNQIPVRGFGSSQFETIPQSFSNSQRMALSRRVDILILDNDGTRPFALF